MNSIITTAQNEEPAQAVIHKNLTAGKDRRSFLMRKDRFFLVRMTVVLLSFAVSLAACSKSEAQSSGGSGDGGSKAAAAPAANPATDFQYDLTADGKGILIKGYTGGPGKVVVPENIEDVPVVEIGSEVFAGETTSVSLYSLGGGGGLNNMNIQSKGNEKAGITEIVLPNTIKKIGYAAFASTAITKFDMPDSVTEIDGEIFKGCKQLTEVHLSDNIEEIRGGIGGTSLKKMNLPKNLKWIGEYAFQGYGELTDLVIPDTLTVSFGAYAVYGGSTKYTWKKVGAKDANRWEGVITTDAFDSCGKLPIKTRQRLQELGYTGKF
jgi:hypothetical protein